MNEVGQQQTQEQEASPAVVYATSRCCHTSCLAPSSGRQGTAALGPGLVTCRRRGAVLSEPREAPSPCSDLPRGQPCCLQRLWKPGLQVGPGAKEQGAGERVSLNPEARGERGPAGHLGETTAQGQPPRSVQTYMRLSSAASRQLGHQELGLCDPSPAASLGKTARPPGPRLSATLKSCILNSKAV